MYEKEINLLGIRKRAILLHSKTPHGVELTIMEPITEEQEIRIDKSSDYFGELQYESKHGTIHQRDIYLYGNIDFNSKDDLSVIKRFNLVDPDLNSFKYTTFNYDKGTAIVNSEGITKLSPSIDCVEWFKYNYCLIGKPKRIIVYKLLKYMLNG